jgi:hypothetical protein
MEKPMSLTSLLKTNADIRDRFRLEFKTPPFGRKDALRAAPVTRNYSLVGTAFDYFLRFRIQRLNPQAIATEWVAENALTAPTAELLATDEALSFMDGQAGIVGAARRELKDYLAGRMNAQQLIPSCLKLATLDLVIRVGAREGIVGAIGVVDQGDVTDMTALASLIDEKTFTTKEACVLNPEFGAASSLVGGADADLLISDTLIEIKTVTNLFIKPEYFQQLMGYYCLSRIEGVPIIRNIGIYFSRHGVLWTAPIENIVDESTLPALLAWFTERAEALRMTPFKGRVTAQ